jgi:type I restriction enzyme S subunit
MLKLKWETEFKETEIGEIPRDWEVKVLRDVLKSLESGKRPKGGALQHDPYGVLSIGGENISWQGDLILDNCLRFSEKFYKNLKKGKIAKDDILLVKDGATIGKLSYIRDVPEGKAMVNEHVFILRTDKTKYHSRFLYYFLLSESGQIQIESSITGSAQGGLNRGILDTIKLPAPDFSDDFSEQSRIATVLSWFDELIENKKRQNEILEKIAMAIFKSWFIDFEPFKNEEFVYNEELGKEIPKEWEVKRLREVAEIIRGVSFHQHESSFEPFPNSIPILRANNVNDDKSIDFKNLMFIPFHKVPESKKLREKDIIMVGSNGNPSLVGKFVVFFGNPDFPEISFGSFMYCIRPRFDYVLSNLNSDYFKKFLSSAVSGTNISNLKKSELENYKLLIPPSPILQNFHSIVEPLFQKIILNHKQIINLRKFRDTLLPLLVFGKLRVEEI